MAAGRLHLSSSFLADEQQRNSPPGAYASWSKMSPVSTYSLQKGSTRWTATQRVSSRRQSQYIWSTATDPNHPVSLSLSHSLSKTCEPIPHVSQQLDSHREVRLRGVLLGLKCAACVHPSHPSPIYLPMGLARGARIGWTQIASAVVFFAHGLGPVLLPNP